MHRRSQALTKPTYPVDSIRRSTSQKYSSFRFTAFFAATLAFVIAGLSCDESLPSYEEPKSILEGWVQGEFQRVGGNAAPQFWVYLRVRNIFDETLQGRKQLTGTFEVVLIRAPEHRKTIALNQTHAIYPYLLRYQTTPTITIDSGDSLVFLYPWNLFDDQGVFLPDAVFSYDSVRHIGVPEDFEISGSFQVFDKTGQIVILPTKCTLNYR